MTISDDHARRARVLMNRWRLQGQDGDWETALALTAPGGPQPPQMIPPEQRHMTAARRNQALAADLASRSVAAAQRRQLDTSPEGVQERLRQAADSAGRIHVNDALAALTGQDTTAPLNPFAAEHNARQARRDQEDSIRLFGELPAAEEPSNQPTGDLDAGKGAGPDVKYDRTDTGEIFEVLDLDNL